MRSSLTKAIGSEVTEEDFSEFVKFHDARLFRKEYVPRPMIWSVRRPRHFPEGTVSIEKVGGGGTFSAGGRRGEFPYPPSAEKYTLTPSTTSKTKG